MPPVGRRRGTRDRGSTSSTLSSSLHGSSAAWEVVWMETVRSMQPRAAARSGRGGAGTVVRIVRPSQEQAERVCRHLSHWLDRLRACGAGKVVIDLSRVRRLDFTGFGVFLAKVRDVLAVPVVIVGAGVSGRNPAPARSARRCRGHAYGTGSAGGAGTGARANRTGWCVTVAAGFAAGGVSASGAAHRPFDQGIHALAGLATLLAGELAHIWNGVRVGRVGEDVSDVVVPMRRGSP